MTGKTDFYIGTHNHRFIGVTSSFGVSTGKQILPTSDGWRRPLEAAGQPTRMKKLNTPISYQCPLPGASNVLKKIAARKPNRVAKPTMDPPLKYASGSIVWAIMVNMAPAATPSTSE